MPAMLVAAAATSLMMLLVHAAKVQYKKRSNSSRLIRNASSLENHGTAMVAQSPLSWCGEATKYGHGAPRQALPHLLHAAAPASLLASLVPWGAPSKKFRCWNTWNTNTWSLVQSARS